MSNILTFEGKPKATPKLYSSLYIHYKMLKVDDAGTPGFLATVEEAEKDWNALPKGDPKKKMYDIRGFDVLKYYTDEESNLLYLTEEEAPLHEIRLLKLYRIYLQTKPVQYFLEQMMVELKFTPDDFLNMEVIKFRVRDMSTQAKDMAISMGLTEYILQHLSEFPDLCLYMLRPHYNVGVQYVEEGLIYPIL